MSLDESLQDWNPLFALLFYVLIPIPLAFCPMVCGADSVWGEFLGSGMILSVFAFPVVLNHNNSIESGHMWYCMGSNFAALGTALGFFWLKKRSEDYY